MVPNHQPQLQLPWRRNPSERWQWVVHVFLQNHRKNGSGNAIRSMLMLILMRPTCMPYGHQPVKLYRIGEVKRLSSSTHS
jgi:hypothetical protein